MPINVTTKLDDESVSRLDELAAKRDMDRQSLMRSFLHNALRDQILNN